MNDKLICVKLPSYEFLSYKKFRTSNGISISALAFTWIVETQNAQSIDNSDRVAQ
jgi:hypothetical protein